MTMTNEEMVAEIKRLQRERDAVIMAHYYVPAEVQEIADFIGDSFFLSKKGTELDCRTIVLAGVRFMAESCKVLNPEKKILLPASDADCPMAHMATVEKIREQRKLHPTDLAVVCYVNSTVEIKAESDVCVTSANAVKVVSRLKEHYIYFVPDQNLAHYVAKQVSDKEFIFNDGYCHVHHGVSVEDVKELKAFYPDAPVLVHPECKEEVLSLCDHIGSTSGIINFVGTSDAKEFIIITECGVEHELKSRYPDRTFHFLPMERGKADTEGGYAMVCPNMKKVVLERVYNALKNNEEQIVLTDELMARAAAPMEKMLDLSK